jgi:hypothetical protein
MAMARLAVNEMIFKKLVSCINQIHQKKWEERDALLSKL